MIIFKNSSVEQAFTMPVSILYQGMLSMYFDYDYWSVVFTQEKPYAADKIQMWNSHCGACLVCEACQEMVSWCRKVSVGICSKPWALPGVRLQLSFWEKDMGWKLLRSWGGSRLAAALHKFTGCLCSEKALCYFSEIQEHPYELYCISDTPTTK